MSKRNIDWLPLACPHLGTEPAIQAYALTENRLVTCLLCRMTPNSLSQSGMGWDIEYLCVFGFSPNGINTCTKEISTIMSNVLSFWKWPGWWKNRLQHGYYKIWTKYWKTAANVFKALENKWMWAQAEVDQSQERALQALRCAHVHLWEILRPRGVGSRNPQSHWLYKSGRAEHLESDGASLRGCWCSISWHSRWLHRYLL